MGKPAPAMQKTGPDKSGAPIRPGSVPLKTLARLFDYFIVPGVILALLYDPNYLHGYINVLESGQYLSTSNAVFQGRVPYKDFFILFGPFQTYMITFVMAIFGKSLSVLRTFFYTNYIISFIIIYVLGRQVCKKRFFAYLIPFICLVEVTHPFWAPRWDFGRMGLGLLALLMIILFLKRKDKRLLAGAGIISSLTIFYTLDVGVIAIVSSVFTITVFSFTCREKGFRDNMLDLFHNIFWYSLGILIILTPFFIFMYSREALSAYLKTNFYIIPKYHTTTWDQHIPSLRNLISGAADFSSLLKDALFYAYLPVFAYLAVFFYLLRSFWRKRCDEEKIVILLLFVYGAACYRTSFRGIFGPQYQVTLPPLIMMICLFSEKGFDYLAVHYKKLKAKAGLKRFDQVKASAITLIIVLLITYFFVSPKRYYVSFAYWVKYQRLKEHLIGGLPVPIFLNNAGLVASGIERVGRAMVPSGQAREMDRVVKYLKENTLEDEPVFCFPELALYNFLADRPAVSRFYIATFAWTAPEWREEILRQLDRERPRVIVYDTRLSGLATYINRSEELLPEVRKYITENYHVIREIGEIHIYERNI